MTAVCFVNLKIPNEKSYCLLFIMEPNPETCLVCLKNNFDDKTLVLFDLSTQEWENVTYLNKLRYVMNADIVIYESTLICSSCLNDLNKAYEFRERVVRALDYWCVMFEESGTMEKKSTEQVENCCNLENNDINNISEINTYNEDNININTNEINTDLTESESTELNEPVETGHTSIEDNKDAHSDDCTNFPCSKCNEIFLTASELIHHNCGTPPKIVKNRKEGKPKPRKRMKKQSEDKFECENCDLSFTKRWMLTKHSRVHTVDKKYMCTFCNRAFKQSYHLREHITSHTGERNYNCEVCGKSFQRLSSQRRHMRTHAAPPGQKAKKSPFLCNICGKSFPYSNGAQRHMRIHTGDKKYECNICSRKFNQSTHLRVHLRTHTGERPYICHACGESFSLKASLHKHMKFLHTLSKGHNDSKNNVKIFQNLEPNLSQTACREDDDEMNKSECVGNDLQMYEQGFLVVCNQ